jgi:hypothetical protein
VRQFRFLTLRAGRNSRGAYGVVSTAHVFLGFGCFPFWYCHDEISLQLNTSMPSTVFIVVKFAINNEWIVNSESTTQSFNFSPAKAENLLLNGLRSQ